MADAPSSVLAGVKVLDLSRVLAGPWCTQILGDFGADVIKIESFQGDDTRRWGPPYLKGPDEDEPGESAYYLSCNRNKRSVMVNIAEPEGAALVRRLAAEADILVENFKVGGLARYGLDYESLSAINPRLVYCSITGFGQDGPYTERPGYDFVAQAMGGLMSITGEAGGAPMKVGVAMADLSTGMYAAVSVLLALRHAERTGQGQLIDCSLLDTQIAMLANQALSFLVDGRSPARLGNAHPTVVPYKTFDAKDGPIVIAVGNDGQFRALCEVIGAADLPSDPRFATNGARVVNRDALEARLQDILADLDGQALIAALVARGVPAGPVNTIAETFADLFVEARGAVRRFLRDDGVEVPSVAYPGKFSQTPADYRRRPPFLGEHTREVLADWLGLDDAALDALTACGAIVAGRKLSHCAEIT
jgi:crotonobetainyl-CoA:carnitine CoA-transferase CaiB-like acyl-CoA transferase